MPVDVGVKFEVLNYNIFLQSMTGANKALDDFETAILKSAAATDVLGNKTQKLSTADLTNQIQNQTTQFGNLNTVLGDTGDKYTATAKDADKMGTAERDAGKDAQYLGGSMTQMSVEVSQSGEKFSVFKEIAIGALREVGAGLTDLAIGGVKALGSFVVGSVQTAADYESTLNRFEAVTGTAIGEAGLDIDDFNKKFLELGAQTQFSAAEAAEAAVNLAKGGIDIPTIMDEGLESVLNLAAAGELELAPAAEIVAKQLGVWADEGVRATEVADLMAQAANASTVDVDDLALGMANVGGVAKLAGLSFEETVTTMALLAPGFSSAADAGTSFKTFLNNLVPTTKPAIEAQIELGLYTKELGSVFYDLDGNFVGMEKTMQLLNDATKDLTEADRALALEAIFGSDAQRAAGIIADGGTQSYKDMTAAMESAGTATEQAALRNKGFNFAMESLKGSLETVQIIIGQQLLPVLTEFINTAIIPGVNWIMELASAIGSSSDPMATFSTGLTTLGTTLSTAILNALPGILAGLESVATSLLTWTGTALPAFITGLGVFAGQLGQWVLDALPGLLANLNTLLVSILEWVTASLPGWIEGLKAFAFGIGDWVLDAIPILLDALPPLMQALADWVLESAPEWGKELIAFADEAIKWIGDALPGLGDELGKFFNEMVNYSVDHLDEWVEALAEFALEVVEWIIDALPDLIVNLGKFAGEILGWIAQTIIDVVPKLADLGMKFLNWIINDVLPTLPSKLAEIWKTVSTAIGNWAEDAIIELGLLAFKFYDWVTSDVLPSLPGALARIWTAISTWISETASSAATAAAEIGASIANGIAGAMGELGGVLWDIVKAAVNPAIDAINGLIDGINAVSGTLGLGTIGRIGRLAAGTDFWRGGLAVAGEKGPEMYETPKGDIGLLLGGLYNLPKGTSVTANSQLSPPMSAGQQMMRNTTNTSTIVNNYNLSTSTQATQANVISQFAQMQALAGII